MERGPGGWVAPLGVRVGTAVVLSAGGTYWDRSSGLGAVLPRLPVPPDQADEAASQ